MSSTGSGVDPTAMTRLAGLFEGSHVRLPLGGQVYDLEDLGAYGEHGRGPASEDGGDESGAASAETLRER